MEDYCIDGDTYSIGTYLQRGDTLILRSGGKAVVREYPDNVDDEVKNTGPAPEVIDCKPTVSKWKVERFKDGHVLVHLDHERFFGSRDTISVMRRIKQLQQDGIVRYLHS